MHQFIGYLGIVILASYLTAYVFDVLHFFGKPYPSKTMYWILSGTPYYPVQIGVGLTLGWLIGRRVRHWAMLWVWVLPLACLIYAVFTIPTLAPNWIPPAFQAGVGESRLKHYFGWGCGGVRPCFDQNAFTLPFYGAAAYSIGALLARKLRKAPQQSEGILGFSLRPEWFFCLLPCWSWCRRFSKVGSRFISDP